MRFISKLPTMSFDNSNTGQSTSLYTGGKQVQDTWGGQNEQLRLCADVSYFREEKNKGNSKGQVCTQAKLMVAYGYNYPIAGN